MSEQEKQQTPGQFTDAHIHQAVIDRLINEPKLDTTGILVEVQEGVVLLKGKADTEEEKKLAEEIAAATPGVSKVENHLHLKTGIVHALSALAAQIQALEEGKTDEKPPKE